MALITKPDFTYVWASGGAVVAPNDAKKQLGWVAEAPPFQYDNWLQNRQDQMLAHINQRGIPAWDGLTNYEAGGLSYVQGSDGKVYKSVAASGPSGVVSNPTTDGTDTYWTIAFADVGAFLTQATGDTRYTQRSNNLGDLTNVTAARLNLGVVKQTSTTDTTAGALLINSAFGLGGAIGLGAANNIDQCTRSGFYTCDSVAGTLPAGIPSGGHLTISGNGSAVAVQCFVPYFTPTRSFIRTWVSPTWTAWQEIALTDSPAFTGTPTAPTAAAGTRSTAIATMQNFANEFGASLAANGYQKLPSGLIIQWGKAVLVDLASAGSTGPTRDITLPVAFPGAALMSFASMGFSTMATSSAYAPGSTIVSNSVIRVQNNYTLSYGDICWLAVGY